MRAGSLLAAGDGFDVNAVRCAGARREFDAPEETTGHGLVFVVIGLSPGLAAALAHELGFADHAHLTRTVRAVTGHTPTSCRRLL